MTTTATFFVSPGRCGTQWLANVLSRAYGDLAEIRHEPLGYRYCPRVLLRSAHGLRGHPYHSDVRDHLAFVRKVLSDRDYIETGWPSFAAIPLLRQEFGARIRVVQIV